MPTYDYVCSQCGYKFELFQQMSEEPSKLCPECGGKLERLIGGGIGVIMKNPGFKDTADSCCGNENPCENPKRCCTK